MTLAGPKVLAIKAQHSRALGSMARNISASRELYASVMMS